MAGDDAPTTRKTKQGWRSGKSLRVLVGAALAAVIMSLYASGGAFALSILVGWLAALAACLAALFSAVQAQRSAYGGLCLAVLLLVVHTAIASRAMRMLPLMIDNAPIVTACLKGLGNSIEVFAQKTGEYPHSLTDLVIGPAGKGAAHPKNLISPMDPANTYRYSYDEWPSGLIYSSYMYRPGRGPFLQDAQIVLAFEYGEWQPLNFRLFPEYGRFVLFGNGEVKLMDSAGLNESLRVDVRRRRELGWPEQMSRPVGVVPFTRPTSDSLPAERSVD